MTLLLDKLMLFIGCTLLFIAQTPEPGAEQVLSLLTAIIFICGMSCCNFELLPVIKLPKYSRLGCLGLYALFLLLLLILPSLRCFLPFLFYELPSLLPRKESGNTFQRRIAVLPFSSLCGILLSGCPVLFLLLHPSGALYFWLLSALCGLALLLSGKTRRLLHLEQEFRLLRDTSTEYHLLLKQKNRTLIEKQDYEIHLATLKERNRIAREIHDNVGHLLSRSLLQSGALIAINQQENLSAPLDALKSSLSSAMDSIRESVHDLHDDSVDLKSSMEELLSDFSDYQISFDYDMGIAVPAPVKYCFISIVKEALSNIARHSNATAISITLREHPVLYQLMISDNGNKNGSNSPGMGLSNMQERVENLNGHFSITREHGFRIFAAIPIVKETAC